MTDRPSHRSRREADLVAKLKACETARDEWKHAAGQSVEAARRWKARADQQAARIAELERQLAEARQALAVVEAERDAARDILRRNGYAATM